MGIARSRLDNQAIGGQTLRDPSDVVRHLGAVQAQDYLASLWAIGLRARGSTERTVERAIAERRFVRTWPMRGTLHYVPADDVHWMLELLTPRVIATSAARYRQLELDDAVFAHCRDVIVSALHGARQLTRPALYRLLGEHGIATAGSRGLHILSHLAQRRVICFGPRAGKQPTFVLLDEWVTTPRRLDRDEALAELATRYFTSHGPATAHDFSWWSGLTLTDVKRSLELAAPPLTQTALDGTAFWDAGSAPGARSRRKHAQLLPAFDEFTVAYRDRSAIVAAAHAARIGAGGMLNPVIVIGDQVAGTWQRTLRNDSVRIALKPFGALSSRDEAAIADAAARYGSFLGLDAVLA